MHRKTLLLINGSQVLMDLTKKIFEREGYSVYCAVGIAGAREQLMDFIPDGIVLENDLPDGNGLDFCIELRQEISLPIMFLSNIKEDELPALHAGANDFLKKPFDYEIMKARISVMLNVRFVSLGSDEDEKHDAVTFSETKATNQLQSVQTQPTEESAKKKKTVKLKRLYVTAAACLMFVLIGAGIFVILNNRLPYFEIPDEQVPLAEFRFVTDENEKLYTDTGTNQYISFPDINSVTLSADTTDAKIFLFNPESNPYYFTFEVILTDTGESLYESNMVEPGMCIDEITLSRGLAKGEYDAVIKIRAYAPEDFAAVSVANICFYITVN